MARKACAGAGVRGWLLVGLHPAAPSGGGQDPCPLPTPDLPRSLRAQAWLCSEPSANGGRLTAIAPGVLPALRVGTRALFLLRVWVTLVPKTTFTHHVTGTALTTHVPSPPGTLCPGPPCP